MNLPLQAPPVARLISTATFGGPGVNGSGIACDICRAACNSLGGIAKKLCLAACNATVC